MNPRRVGESSWDSLHGKAFFCGGCIESKPPVVQVTCAYYFQKMPLPSGENLGTDSAPTDIQLCRPSPMEAVPRVLCSSIGVNKVRGSMKRV